MTLIIHVDDPGDIIGVKEAIAPRPGPPGGVRVVAVKPDKERQVSLWRHEKST